MKKDELEAARAAAAKGLRQEWKVTFYEADEDGTRKLDGQAFTRFIMTSPFASARPTAHTVFVHLHGDPNVPEVDMVDYDIEKTALVPEEAEHRRDRLDAEKQAEARERDRKAGGL